MNMEQTAPARRSTCCGATVRSECGEPWHDGAVEVRTCWFECTGCGMPCDTVEHTDKEAHDG